MQYIFCTRCLRAKDRIVVIKGDSLCLECAYTPRIIDSSEVIENKAHALGGLSELFDK